jgi:hypothetical protein
MNAEELMVKSLVDSGYHQIEDREEMDEDNLGTKEFFVAPVGNQRILCLGPGHSGDTGCKVKFYFVNGVLMGHAAFYEEEEE